jgi:hypothetical protein
MEGKPDGRRTCRGGTTVKGDLSYIIRMHLRYSDGPQGFTPDQMTLAIRDAHRVADIALGDEWTCPKY